jgi:Mrp family chromosome partitioning ATPase
MVAHLFRGVMMVVSAGRTRAYDMQESVGRLRHVDAPLIGVVINRASRGEVGGYGYTSYTPYG